MLARSRSKTNYFLSFSTTGIKLIISLYDLCREENIKNASSMKKKSHLIEILLGLHTQNRNLNFIFLKSI